MVLSRRIFRLKGIVQHYSWGGHTFIPELLTIENKEQKPFAEYWMGAHPNHPAILQDRNEEPLSDFILRNKEEVLGEGVAQKFSALPYLFKILDVRKMLSIQVHPSKRDAEKSFEEENQKGISIHAPHRNYKDRNHKPELMVALSDFYLLHGFKNEKDLLSILNSEKELYFLEGLFHQKGYKGLYEEVMLMEQGKVNGILEPLIRKILPLYSNGSLSKENESFWAARAAVDFCKDGFCDRGIFSIYLFNLVHLKAGEGIFQPAGMPHAYLEGQNVEVMANSDNVLRAGLTDKHIDVPELMRHVKFEATIPNILNPQTQHRIFFSSAEEFELQCYQLSKSEEKVIQTRTAETFLVTTGAIEVQTGNERLDFSAGESFFVIAGTVLTLKAVSEAGLFRVTVPW